MGLKNWIFKKFYGIDVEEIKIKAKSDGLVEIADEYLRRGLNEHKQTMQVAEKLNRANLLAASTSQLKATMSAALQGQGDGENDEDEDYDEDDENPIEAIGKDMATELLKSVIGGRNRQQAAPSIDWHQNSTEGVPSPAASAASSATPSVKDKYRKMLEDMPEDVAKNLDAKFGHFLK